MVHLHCLRICYKTVLKQGVAPSFINLQCSATWLSVCYQCCALGCLLDMEHERDLFNPLKGQTDSRKAFCKVYNDCFV